MSREEKEKLIKRQETEIDLLLSGDGCHCKGKCSSRKCPCRDYGKECSAACSCLAQRCVNRKVSEDNSTVINSSFENH